MQMKHDRCTEKLETQRRFGGDQSTSPAVSGGACPIGMAVFEAGDTRGAMVSPDECQG